MKSKIWIFVICVEFVASLPNTESQPFANSNYYPLPDYLAQPSNGPLPNYLAQPSNGPLPNYLAQPGDGPLPNHIAQPGNDELLNHFSQPGNDQLPNYLAQPDNDPSPNHLAQPGNGPLPNYLAQPENGPLPNYLAPPSYVPLPNYLAQPENGAQPTAPGQSSSAAAERPSNSKDPVATETKRESQIISPAIAKAISNADAAFLIPRTASQKVVNTVLLVVDAVKKAANAKADKNKPFDINCSSNLSSDPDLNNLSKIYKDLQDDIISAYSTFQTMQDTVYDLVKKIEDNANAPINSQSSCSPPDSSNKEQPSNNEESAQGSQNQPDNQNQGPVLEDDEDPNYPEDEDWEDDYQSGDYY